MSHMISFFRFILTNISSKFNTFLGTLQIVHETVCSSLLLVHNHIVQLYNGCGKTNLKNV